jgi:hypothetical protein
MSTDHREEIAASVAAHGDLGPGYDRAVAEGLVERIGDEIDRRVATKIDQRVAAELEQYLDCRHLRRARRRARVARPARGARPPVLFPLGSLTAAVLATLIVLQNGTSVNYANNGGSRSGAGFASLLLVALIWVVVGVVNVVHVRHQQQQRQPPPS